MRTALANIKSDDILSKTLSIAIFVGVVTILLVLNVDRSNNDTIALVGELLSGIGNDLFLVIANVLIIGWAWRKRLKSVIKLTLGVDVAVFVLAQGIKKLNLGSWNIRPHGGTDGFPSGHATHAFAMAFLLTIFFPRFAWLWYMCAAAISWSRIETNAHNGFQITAGVLLGTSIAWVLVTRWLKHYDAAIIKSRNIEQNQTM